ncbi:TonB-dependent receptor [bacterium]|nr:TonB-dependent receptor [bacterium]
MLNENKTRRYILQIACLLFVSLVHAQELKKVSGVVSSDGEAVISAHIMEYSSMKLIAITDIQGRFYLETADSALIVSAIGYDSAVVSLNSTVLEIELNKITDLLDQVVVSESRSQKALKESTVSLDLIQPKLIQLTAPTDIRYTMSRLNGVQVVDGQPNIRAGSGWSYGAGSRVQVLVNGLPMLSGDASQPQWAFIPTEGVERIEVIKGAASVIYGSSALNGVINVHTRTSTVKPYTFLSFTTGAYSRPTRSGLDYGQGTPIVGNVSAFHVSKIGELDFHLGMNVLYDQGYKMNDYERRARVNFGLRKVNSDKQRIYGINTAVMRGTSASFLLWDNYEHGYTILDSGLTETQGWRVSIDPYWSQQTNNGKHEIKGRYFRVANDVDNGDTARDQSNFSDLMYLEYQFTHKFENKLKLITGAVGQYAQTQSPLFSGTQVSNNAAAYVQLERKWGKLLTNGGIRYEYFRLNHRQEMKPVVRAGLNYELAKATFLRASYGQGYRFPSIAEAYVSTSVGPVELFPNPDIKSETGDNIEIGIKQGFKIKGIQGMIDIAAYRMNFQNMTEFTFAAWKPFNPPADLGFGFKSVNIPETRVQGLELSIVSSGKIQGFEIQGFAGYNLNSFINLQPDSVVLVDANGSSKTYRELSYSEAGNELKYRPRHSFKADIIVEYKRFYIGAGVAAQTEFVNIDTNFTYSLIASFVPGVDSAMKDGISAYTIWNFRAGYKFNDHFQLNFIVDNAFNHEFMIRPADLGPPRRIRCQISYTFK